MPSEKPPKPSVELGTDPLQVSPGTFSSQARSSAKETASEIFADLEGVSPPPEEASFKTGSGSVRDYGTEWERMARGLESAKNSEKEKEPHILNIPVRLDVNVEPQTGVPAYRGYLRRTSEAFGQLSPLERLEIADTSVLICQTLVVVVFALWWRFVPWASIADLAISSVAYAAPAGLPGGFDPKPLIHIAIFISLFVTFLVSIWVHYFSKSEHAADSAGTVSKTLLGFFIGAATNYLGITS